MFINILSVFFIWNYFELFRFILYEIIICLTLLLVGGGGGAESAPRLVFLLSTENGLRWGLEIS